MDARRSRVALALTVTGALLMLAVVFIAGGYENDRSDPYAIASIACFASAAAIEGAGWMRERRRRRRLSPDDASRLADHPRD